MIEVDCRKCVNCTGEECIPFGKDADIAVNKCADGGFENYVTYEELEKCEMRVIDMVIFTSGNSDNTTEAVHGLDIFTKNWCMNCEETEKQDDLIFRCDECEFQQTDGKCLVKIFSHEHKHNYPLSDFGSMGEP